jgi:hypothetical protein
LWARPLHHSSGTEQAGETPALSGDTLFRKLPEVLMRPISMNCWHRGGIGQGCDGERSRWRKQGAACKSPWRGPANLGLLFSWLVAWSQSRSGMVPFEALPLLRVKRTARDCTVRMRLYGLQVKPQAVELISVGTWKEVGFHVRVRRSRRGARLSLPQRPRMNRRVFRPG